MRPAGAVRIVDGSAAPTRRPGRLPDVLPDVLAGGLVVLTDRTGPGGRPHSDGALVDVVRAAVDGGARTVLLRDRDLPVARRVALAEALREVLAPAGGRLIVAGTDPLGGAAVHLSRAEPCPPAAPDVIGRPCRVEERCLVGRSCHDERELARVSTEDYVSLSPVFPTASKPGYGPPLGVDGLARLVTVSPVPVVALGGITTPERAARCVAAGAAAVAVMGAVMRAVDPASVVAGLAAAVRTAVGAGSAADRGRCVGTGES